MFLKTVEVNVVHTIGITDVYSTNPDDIKYYKPEKKTWITSSHPPLQQAFEVKIVKFLSYTLL